MKTREERNDLREEVKTLNRRLAELTEEELEQVTGGRFNIIRDDDPANGSDDTPGNVQ